MPIVNNVLRGAVPQGLVSCNSIRGVSVLHWKFEWLLQSPHPTKRRVGGPLGVQQEPSNVRGNVPSTGSGVEADDRGSGRCAVVALHVIHTIANGGRVRQACWDERCRCQAMQQVKQKSIMPRSTWDLPSSQACRNDQTRVKSRRA
ncbi:hypothetical protein LIA77_00716 [Sarocladium implicatum]|nr:hypothetical protein LIA77_00716 [Sarocladium implicatum]